MHCPLPSSRHYPVREDFRDPYSRDRDRVIHCSSFRRLEYKTQVFINSVGDYFRTRLTHSLEVSQIARSIARNLGLNEPLAEVIALSHDLGHTPFGHAGGDELDFVLKQAGFPNGFEHNFQSFRVVTKLEKRYAEFDGLNLTFATLEGILKHSQPYKKPFITHDLSERYGLDYHPSLEAILVDHADEIAYLTHDIDDGVKYALISIESLSSSSLVQQVRQKVEKEGIGVGDPLFRYRFSGEMINLLVYAFIEHSRRESAGGSQPRCCQIPASTPLAFGFPEEMKGMLRELKALLFQQLYRHEQVMRKMHYGKLCIRELFGAFMEEENLLPLAYRELLQRRPKHRVIADYIAGMSDRFAMDLYKELFVGQSGSY